MGENDFVGPVAGGRRRIDRILDPGYLGGLEGVPLGDIRAKRTECEAEEALLSYERRLLHARLDILRAELRRRADGGPVSSIVEELPRILSGEPRTSRGSFPREIALPDLENPRRRVERMVSDDTLARIPDLEESDIRGIIETLSAAERDVSEARRAVQGVLDRLTAEVVRRYKSGEADPADAISGDR